MFEFLFFLLSITPDNLLPTPTPEQRALVQQMGDEEWAARQEASTKMKKLERDGLKALLEGTKNEDLEIRTRCRRAVNHILTFGDKDGKIVPIHGLYDLGEVTLRSGKVFKDGEDLCRHYWTEAGGTTNGEWVQEDDRRLTAASQRFAEDMFKVGFSKDDISDLYDQIRQNAKRENLDKLTNQTPQPDDE